MTEKRLIKLFCFFMIFAFIIQINMVGININQKYIGNAQLQQFKTFTITKARGDILDCNFQKLTDNEPVLKALITPNTENLQGVFYNISEENRKKFYQQLNTQKIFLTEIEGNVDGLTTFDSYKRYSDFNTAQHVLGYLNGDGVGISGMEKAFESEIKNSGEKVDLIAEIDGYGNIIDYKTEKSYQHSSNHPAALVVTIDNVIQKICEAVAKEYIPNGSIVVMESKTGKIKAMVSTPFYNANNIKEYLDMPNAPLVNKALQAYEPGSVIKPLWASMLLQNGFNKNKQYICKGYTDVNGHVYHCANNTAHGEMNMQRALEVSCNCYFIDAYMEDKAFYMKQLANQVNIGLPIELGRNYFTTSGYFPTIDEIQDLGQRSSVSFGQGKFLITPVHVAAYMNMFANKGVYIYPQLCEGIYDTVTSGLISNLYSYQCKQVIEEKVAEEIKQMLGNVVENGARGRAKPTYYSAGGKTGTAQTGKVNPDESEIFTAWFCGFYPLDNPQYTICITLYNGGESTQTAAPIFKKVCDGLYYLLAKN